MKTFKDLQFVPHRVGVGLHAVLNFPNGYGVSVVRFKVPGMSVTFSGSHTSDDTEWEVGILKDGELTYETPLTDDVLGHQSEEQVTAVMRALQEMPESP